MAAIGIQKVSKCTRLSALGSINGINEVTSDRSITLYMARGTDISTVNRA
jgi:hypothetical protein